MNNILQSGLTHKQIREILNPELEEFSKKIAIDYSRMYGKAFIESFVKFKSVRMACGFAVGWFEKEFGEGEKDFGGFCGKLNLSENDKKLLERTLNMIFILKN